MRGVCINNNRCIIYIYNIHTYSLNLIDKKVLSRINSIRYLDDIVIPFDDDWNLLYDDIPIPSLSVAWITFDKKYNEMKFSIERWESVNRMNF